MIKIVIINYGFNFNLSITYSDKPTVDWPTTWSYSDQAVEGHQRRPKPIDPLPYKKVNNLRLYVLEKRPRNRKEITWTPSSGIRDRLTIYVVGGMGREWKLRPQQVVMMLLHIPECRITRVAHLPITKGSTIQEICGI